jgi:hypothetical protein
MSIQLNTPIVQDVAVAQSILLPANFEQAARQVLDTFNDKLKASLNGRQEKALKLALNGHVTRKAEHIYSVRSENGDRFYLVDLERKFCTCPDSEKGNACKHRLAAYLIEQGLKANIGTSVQAANTPSAPKMVAEARPISPQEESLEKARLALHARSQFLRDAIIYAVLTQEDTPIPVEVIDIEGDVALVRALPTIKDGRLIPHFPFPEKKSAAQVVAKTLSEVRIYR